MTRERTAINRCRRVLIVSREVACGVAGWGSRAGWSAADRCWVMTTPHPALGHLSGYSLVGIGQYQQVPSRRPTGPLALSDLDAWLAGTRVEPITGLGVCQAVQEVA